MAFTILPVEVNAQIAGHMTDQEIAVFARICRETCAGVYSDRSPLWRTKFVEHYDLVPGSGNNDLRRTYQHRRRILRRGCRFDKGTTNSEQRCLRVLRELMIESYASGRVSINEDGAVVSRNILAMKKFALESDLLRDIFSLKQSDKQNHFLTIVQIMLMDVRFENLAVPRGFPTAQKAMYATAEHEPLLKGRNKTEVNLNWVLNACQFFKQHLGSDENPLLTSEYKNLKDHERIKAPRRALRNGAQRLGKTWKGAYAYLDHAEIYAIRTMPADEDPELIDEFNENDDGSHFQSLRLGFPPKPSTKRWPKLFERHLKSLSHPSASYLSSAEKSNQRSPSARRTTRAQHRCDVPVTAKDEVDLPAEKIDPKPISFNFQGSGVDNEKFYAAGWLNPLPPQQGIPGWQRWTMMKYFVDDDNSDSDDDPFGMSGVSGAHNNSFAHMDENALWAYEGIVLPGGEIVVGRWWSPESEDEVEGDGMYSGPFIFWNVDEKGVEA